MEIPVALRGSAEETFGLGALSLEEVVDQVRRLSHHPAEEQQRGQQR
jgi:hypothetical protein